MNVTILNYIDQDLVNQINEQAAARAEAARIEAEKATEASSETDSSDFSSVLENAAAASKTDNSTSDVSCPENLADIFAEASETYGVSEKLLLCIAKTESNFNANATSSTGAMGIMQLMPATASALGVTNAYDARENIMGGASLMAQHLQKYNGNVSLALAAYNAGSNAVDQYGGIPPYAETQTYVQKVLGYMDTDITIPESASSTASADTSASADKNTLSDLDTSGLDSLFALTGEERDKANAAIESYLVSQNISLSRLQDLIADLKADETEDSENTDASSSAASGQKQFTVTVLQGIDETALPQENSTASSDV